MFGRGTRIYMNYIAAAMISLLVLTAACDKTLTPNTFRGDLALALQVADDYLKSNGRLEDSHAQRLYKLHTKYSEVLAGSETLAKLELLVKTIEAAERKDWPQANILLYRRNKEDLLRWLDSEYPR